MFTLQAREQGKDREFKYFNLGDDFQIDKRVVTGRDGSLRVTVGDKSIATILNGLGNVVHTIIEAEQHSLFS